MLTIFCYRTTQRITQIIQVMKRIIKEINDLLKSLIELIILE
jgi:hypothetical protein